MSLRFSPVPPSLLATYVLRLWHILIVHTMTFALNSKISDVVGCQNSGLGWVRMSPTKVRVRFRCQLLGFVWVRVIFVRFSGFSGVVKFLKFWPLLLFFIAFLCLNIFQTSKIYNLKKNYLKKIFHLMKNLFVFGEIFLMRKF